MHYYDAQLQQLQQQAARKRQLAAMLEELREQRRKLADKVDYLESAKYKEQADVDRLEGRSLAAFFCRVAGRMDEKLDRERQEAHAASVKYDAAAKELAAVQEDIRAKKAELDRLRGCEECYQQLLQEKKESVKAAGGAAAEEILRLEERIACLEEQKKELREATAAGRSALSAADEVLSSLDSADGWAAWDMLGGGLMADMAKHGHLDDAQDAVERLQVRLSRFKTELADVAIRADMQVNIDGLLLFADYFFDGLFADWAVRGRISQSQGQAEQTRGQIQRALHRLNDLARTAELEQSKARHDLEQLVRQAPFLSL